MPPPTPVPSPSTGTCGSAARPSGRTPSATRRTRSSCVRRAARSERQARAGRRRGPPARPPGRGGGMGNDQFGFYLPFNWRGFYDFGSSLIGDWGIHQLGPANWGLFLTPEYLGQRRVHQEGQRCRRRRSRTSSRSSGSSRRARACRRSPCTGSGPGRRRVPAAGHDGRAGAQDPGHGPDDRSAGGDGDAGRGARRRGWRAGGARRGGCRRGGQRAGAAGRPRAAAASRAAATTPCSSAARATWARAARRERRPASRVERWADYTLPPRILTRSPGHQRDWIRACKGGEPACSNFGIAGPYTEWMVLGAAAARVAGKLLYDAKTGRSPTAPRPTST